MSKLILLIDFVTAGVLIFAICVPLIFGWIGPNSWYGFRTPRTLADPKTWYAVNAVAGKRLAAAALTIVAGAIGFYFVPRWELPHYAIANLAVTAFALGYAMVQSTMYLTAFKTENAEEQAVSLDPDEVEEVEGKEEAEEKSPPNG